MRQLTLSQTAGFSSELALVGMKTRWSITASTLPSGRSTARERILAVKELWSQEAAEFHGDYVDFSPSLSYPKPVSNPPIIMGGSGGPVTFKHVVEYCDGWMPIHGRADPLEKIDLLHQMAEDGPRPGVDRVDDLWVPNGCRHH